MSNTDVDYDLIVISREQAGLKVAKEAARLGKTALILTLNPGSIASVMCSTSMNRSPGGHDQAGVEANQLRLVEDPKTGALSFTLERLDTDSRHSVYILQGDTEPQPFDPTQAFEPTPAPSLPPVKKTATEKTASKDEHGFGYGFTAYRDREREQLKETLRERDIFTRNKLLHRPLSSERAEEEPDEPTDEPIIRREKDFRKRMTRDYRQLSDRGNGHQPPQKSWPQTQLQPFSSGRREEPEHSKPPLERRLPFSSATPQERKKPFDPQRETVQEDSSQNATIPGARVWEADGDSPARKKEEWDQAESPSVNAYQPFQRPREAPARTNHPLPSSGEAPFLRKHRQPVNNRERRAPTGYGRDWAKREQTGPLSRKQMKKEATMPPRESPKTPLPRSQRNGQQPFMNQEAARHILRNTSRPSSQEQGLKRDNIDIEDPYGQSYEDFMEPFRSSSPDHQLEKRKLALRGLHNLINNLG